MPTNVKNAGFSTRAIHHGYDPQEHHGALVPPIYMSTTFGFPSAEYGERCFAGQESAYTYSRISNPTLALLESRMAELEGGESAVAFASGMGAITSTLWTLLRPGDEIIADRTLYGCTFAFLTYGIGQFGVSVRFIDMSKPEELSAAITSRAKAICFESPSNPNMRMVDIAAVSKIAHQHNLKVIVDNTYCTPYLQRPIELGADVVLHSATKYLSGHGDITAGIAISSKQIVEQVRARGLKEMTGAVLSPHDAFLLLRGMKTLSLRMERHCSSAAAIAELLSQHPIVEIVHFPGLESFAQHELAKRQMARFGGMIAFELRGGKPAAKLFMNLLQLFSRAVSLGDAESLVQHPASMTHSTYTAEERMRHGISEKLVRLSVGLEDTQDLLDDVKQALDACCHIAPSSEIDLNLDLACTLDSHRNA